MVTDLKQSGNCSVENMPGTAVQFSGIPGFNLKDWRYVRTFHPAIGPESRV